VVIAGTDIFADRSPRGNTRYRPIPIVGEVTLLARTALLFVVLLVLHALDHGLRQDASVPSPLAVVGLSGTVIAAGVLVLALRRHPLAPPAAVFVGLGTALGFALAHLIPHWSGAFSQFYGDLDVDALSWTGVFATMAAGAALGLAGLRAARAGGRRVAFER